MKPLKTVATTAHRLKYLLFLCCLFETNKAVACAYLPSDQIVIEENGIKVAINIQPDSLVVGQLFSLAVTICDEEEQPFIGNIKATAIMPAHNHGMNYQPRFIMTAPGQYLGTGFLFHMPGKWQLKLNLHWDENMERITYDFHL